MAGDPRSNVPHGEQPSGRTTSSPDKGDVRPAEGGVGTGTKSDPAQQPQKPSGGAPSPDPPSSGR